MESQVNLVQTDDDPGSEKTICIELEVRGEGADMRVTGRDQHFHLQDHEVEILSLSFGICYLHQCVFWILPAVDCDLFTELKHLDVQFLSGI